MPTPHIIGLDVNGQNICGVNTTTKSIFETTTTEPVITTESLVFRSKATRTSPKKSPKETNENKNESEQGSDEYETETYDYPGNVDCSKYGQIKQIRDDLENKKCTEFSEDGYRCVPYYACHDGEIVTNAVGLIDLRTDPEDESDTFNPSDSKCEESLDICCRHPDWRDVPLKQEIKLPPKIPDECLNQYNEPSTKK